MPNPRDLTETTARWTIYRRTDGSVHWSLVTHENGREIVTRGQARSPQAARGALATALVETVSLRKVPEHSIVRPVRSAS